MRLQSVRTPRWVARIATPIRRARPIGCDDMCGLAPVSTSGAGEAADRVAPARDGRRARATAVRTARASTSTAVSAWPNTRLAIVDLAGGDQPISDERRPLLGDAERRDLQPCRAALRARAARSPRSRRRRDTEVIAHAYEEWGVDCLDRFNGDFAIAVWDRERRELFLARDRFGVRPLFLAEYGGDVCFASEAKALLRHPRSRRELDPVAIVDTFTHVDAPAGPLRLRRHPRAAAGPLCASSAPTGRAPRRAGGTSTSRRATRRPRTQLVEQLEALLVDAIRIRLRADVPVATYLSGGLDSSAIAAIAARQLQDEHAVRVRASASRTSATTRAPSRTRSRASSGPSSGARSSTRRRSPRRSARRRAGGEAAAPDGAGAAPAALRGGAGRGPEGRPHGRGRGRAVRRLRHLPRGQGSPLLGARPRVELRPLLLRAPEPLPRDRPGARAARS